MSLMPIHTPRLLLRYPTSNDIPVLCRLMNDPAIAADYGGVRYPCTPFAVRRWLAQKPERPDAVRLNYLIVLRSNQRIVIGGAYIAMSSARSWPTIGYWIANAHRRKGFATETAKALISAIFPESPVEIVMAHCYTGNLASQRVLASAGMRRVGNGWIKNVQHQCRLPGLTYQITRKAWGRQHA